MPLLPILGLGAALLSAFGKKKQGDAQTKLAQANAANEFETKKRERSAREARFNSAEKGRIGALKSLVAIAGQRGIKGIDLSTLDPAMFEPRPFAEADPVAPPKETGRSTFGSILQGVGDIGGAAVDFMGQQQAQQKREAETNKLMCVLVPQMCQGDPSVGPPAPPPTRGDVGGDFGGRA